MVSLGDTAISLHTLLGSESSKCQEDPISHMPLAGATVASWSLTQEVAGSNSFTVMTNILATEFSEFN